MNIPSIPVLRAFIEVARCNSFTRAADTLCLTQSAVSKQVQTLEEQLGCRLFVRSGKTLTLTPAGHAYLAHANDALAMLQEGRAIAQEVAGEKAPASAVEISASPAFASYWLIPRLPGFRERAPGTRLIVRPRLPDFSPVTERFDLEVRVGAGRWPDARAIRLLGREMALVASPELLGDTRATLRQLQGLPVLHRAQRGYDWREWSASAAPGWNPRAGAGLLFEGFSVLIPAVVAGLGVAICPLFLVLDQLEAGRLVRPLGECVRTRYAYHAVLPTGASHGAARDRFLDWMLVESETTQMRIQKHLDSWHSMEE